MQTYRPRFSPENSGTATLLTHRLPGSSPHPSGEKSQTARKEETYLELELVCARMGLGTRLEGSGAETKPKRRLKGYALLFREHSSD